MASYLNQLVLDSQIGTPTTYWYRVQSKPTQLASGSPLDSNGLLLETQGSTFIVNVMATSPTEAYQKLVDRGLAFAVKSIYQFSPPALMSEAPPNADYSSLTLTDVTSELGANSVAFVDAIIDLANATGVMTLETPGSPVPPSGGFGMGDINLGGNCNPTVVYHDTGSLSLYIGGNASPMIVGTQVVDIKTLGMFMLESEFGTFAPISGPAVISDANTLIFSSCCSSDPTPILMNIQHGLESVAVFSQFIQRNAITFPSILPIVFNQNLGIWQENFVLSGISSTSNHLQVWKLNFEFGCVDANLISSGTASLFWKLAVNIATMDNDGNTVRTRFIGYYDTGVVCNPNLPMAFTTTINTTMYTTTPLTALQPVLFDEIGLFASASWMANPMWTVVITSPTNISADSFVNYPEVDLPISSIRAARPVNIELTAPSRVFTATDMF